MMKLLLHPGVHKTGTTSIQQVLFDNRRWLSHQGLVYPIERPFVGPRAHHNFAHALAHGGTNEKETARRFLETAANNARPSDTVIISSEPIYRHYLGSDDWAGLVAADYSANRRAYLAVLAEILEDFDVEVILYLRDYGYWLAWLHRVLKREKVWAGGPARFKKEFGERFAFEHQIAMFADYFPRVRTFRYEEAKEQGLITHFFDTIGFPAPPGSATIWERPTKRAIVPL
jgi:hypothetical protein